MQRGLGFFVLDVKQRLAQRDFGVGRLAHFHQHRTERQKPVRIIGHQTQQLAERRLRLGQLPQLALRIAQAEIGRHHMGLPLDGLLKSGDGFVPLPHAGKRGAVQKSKPRITRGNRARPSEQRGCFRETPLLQPDHGKDRHKLIRHAMDQQRPQGIFGCAGIAALQQLQGASLDLIQSWREISCRH